MESRKDTSGYAKQFVTKAFDGPVVPVAIGESEMVRRAKDLGQQSDSLILEMSGSVGHDLDRNAECGPYQWTEAWAAVSVDVASER